MAKMRIRGRRRPIAFVVGEKAVDKACKENLKTSLHEPRNPRVKSAARSHRGRLNLGARVLLASTGLAAVTGIGAAVLPQHS